MYTSIGVHVYRHRSTAYRVGEPVLELFVALEDVGHEEVEQTPELHEVVLERRAREQQPPLGVEVEQRLPALRAEVLDVVGLVKDLRTRR